MGVNIVGRDRVGVEVEAREEERPRIPSWFGEAVLWGQYWLESGLVGYLEEEVRVVRGRMVSRTAQNGCDPLIERVCGNLLMLRCPKSRC